MIVFGIVVGLMVLLLIGTGTLFSMSATQVLGRSSTTSDLKRKLITTCSRIPAGVWYLFRRQRLKQQLVYYNDQDTNAYLRGLRSRDTMVPWVTFVNICYYIKKGNCQYMLLY